MTELATDALHRLDEAAVIARVTRYSNLRGVERALLPSVRRRIRLPTTHLGSAILVRLQRLLEQLRRRDERDRVVLVRAARELEQLDEALADFAAALTRMVDEMPIAQLRATLQTMLDRSRGEVAALLDLCLETFVPVDDGEPPHKVDYLVTLLARQRVGEVAVLRCDPCAVTPGVAARCAAEDASPDLRAAEFARLFRDAQIELLGADDLEEIVQRMRKLKGRLGACWFDRDVLRAIVGYNVAAENRFRELYELEHRRDAAIERTLRALSELDLATPGRERPSASPADADAPGMRALEEALRDRLATRAPEGSLLRRLAESIDLDGLEADESAASGDGGADPTDVLTRAAVLVGLALRDLPSLTARLRELDVDVSSMETRWVRELDDALRAAIEALAKSGRAERAARLARTRMRYLSSH